MEDLPMTPRRFAVAWSQLEAAGYTRADWDAGLVHVVDGLEHGQPINGDVVRGWSKPLALLPKCALLTGALTHLRDSMLARGDDWAKASREVFDFDPIMSGSASTPPRLQDQDQDQDQEQNQERESASASPRETENPPTPFSKVDLEEKTEKPARVAMLVKVPIPENWTLSADYIARLELTYHRRDIEAQIARFPGKARSKAWTSADWNDEFVSFIEREAGWGNVTPKPPSQQTKPKAEPATPKVTTTDQDREKLAEWEAMIATGDPTNPAHDYAIASRDRLVAKMAVDAARLAEVTANCLVGFDEPEPDAARSFIYGDLAKTTPDAANDEGEAVS